MKYCKNCLQPDTRPSAKFSDDGPCPAGVYYQQSKTVNWSARFAALELLVQKYQNPHVKYDYIIGVSGGKGSARQVVWAKEKLGRNPLLLCLNYSPDQMSALGATSIFNLIDPGFDLVNISLSPATWKQFMRKSFLEFSNWCKSNELTLFSSVFGMALDQKW